MWLIVQTYCVFFFNDTATTEIYTLSLHDALPIWPADAPDRLEGRRARPPARRQRRHRRDRRAARRPPRVGPTARHGLLARSEEHTSELQSRQYLVCRLLLEKKKKKLQHATFMSIT